MRLTPYIAALGLAWSAVSTAFAASDAPAWAEVAEADRLLMGDYEGEWVTPPEKSYQAINPHLVAQVINVEAGRYRLRFMQDFDSRADNYFDGHGVVAGAEIALDEQGWKASVSENGLTGTARIGEREIGFALKRVERLSPTLGLKAPAGAVVLFDGTSLEAWEHDDGRAASWRILGDGSMEIDPGAENRGAEPAIGGDIRTKLGFKDVRLHLEFRYPVEPGRRGQDRGNSGLFFQGAYETQILNSYGLEGNWNELGALYKLSPPRVNAARPPMQWQTYDVVYRAPRYKDGKLVEKARMWSEVNGVRAQWDQELTHHTAHVQADRDKPAPVEAGPIRLQDHSNRIQFRNIWLVELDLPEHPVVEFAR